VPAQQGRQCHHPGRRSGSRAQVLYRGAGPREARRLAVRPRQPLDRGCAARRRHTDRDCPPGPNVTAGRKDTGISLQTDDIDAYHAQLKDRGVDVDAEVTRFSDAVPPLFWFRDPEGNTLMVVEGR
jgi:hypothetical protein